MFAFVAEGKAKISVLAKNLVLLSSVVLCNLLAQHLIHFCYKQNKEMRGNVSIFLKNILTHILSHFN